MVDSLNKVMLIGNVGEDPRITDLSSGKSKKVASFSLATSHSWIDNSGEKQNHTDWHRVVVYGEGLVGIIEKIKIRKGTKLFIEGKLVNRKWTDKDNNKRLTVEVVLQGYNCSLIVLSPNNASSAHYEEQEKKGFGPRSNSVSSQAANFGSEDFDEFFMDDELDLGEEKLPY